MTQTQTRTHYLDCPTPEVAGVVVRAPWALFALEPQPEPGNDFCFMRSGNIYAQFDPEEGMLPREWKAPQPGDLILIREPWMWDDYTAIALRVTPLRDLNADDLEEVTLEQRQAASEMPDFAATRRIICEVRGPARVAGLVTADAVMLGFDATCDPSPVAKTALDRLREFWTQAHPDIPFETAWAWLVRAATRRPKQSR